MAAAEAINAGRLGIVLGRFRLPWGVRMSRPRIRTIKPEIWQHSDFLALSPVGRLTFLALMSNADDEGRLQTDPGHLASTYLFGCHSDEIAEQLEDMEARRLVVAYQFLGKRFIAIRHWSGTGVVAQRIDRPSTSELPAPPKFKRGGSRNNGQLELESLAIDRERSAPDPTVSVSDRIPITSGARLCEQLKGALDEWGAKAVITSAWRLAEDRLLRIDERPPDEAREVLAWATHDDFWRPNIMSLPTFRKQYDKLRGQMLRAPGKGADKATPQFLRERAAELAREGD